MGTELFTQIQIPFSQNQKGDRLILTDICQASCLLYLAKAAGLNQDFTRHFFVRFYLHRELQEGEDGRKGPLGAVPRGEEWLGLMLCVWFV